MTGIEFHPPILHCRSERWILCPRKRYIFSDCRYCKPKPEDHDVYVTVIYDVIEGHPEDFDNVRPILFNARESCTVLRVAPPAKNGTFDQIRVWTPTIEGEIVGMTGLLSDGGMSIDVSINNKTVCTSTASYAVGNQTLGFVSAGASLTSILDRYHTKEGYRTEVSGSNSSHIIRMTTCSGSQLGVTEIKKGQIWTLGGHYDFD